jgi:hypothetical protein
MSKTKKERRKEKQIKLRNKKLCKKYPFIIPRSVCTGEIIKDYDYSWTEYDYMARGWRIGFGKFWLEDLRRACIETNYLGKLYFLQVKEKYASLRAYPNAAPKKVYDILDKYEYISQCICYQCGSPETSVVNDYGWYLPICKKCWDKFNRKREKKGYKVISYNEAGGEDNPKLPDSYSYSIYSNGEDKTVVVDIGDITSRINQAYKNRVVEEK